MDVVDGLTERLMGFLHKHGWHCVGLTIAWYMTKDSVLAWMAERERRGALQRANDPQRRSVLEAERQRVREAQQAQAAREAAATKERLKREKDARIYGAPIPQKSPDVSGGAQASEPSRTAARPTRHRALGNLMNLESDEQWPEVLAQAKARSLSIVVDFTVRSLVHSGLTFLL